MKFKEFITKNKPNIIRDVSIILEGDIFHTVVINNSETLRIECWNLDDFVSLHMEINKAPLSLYLQINQAETLNIILKFLRLEHTPKDIQIAIRERLVMENLKRMLSDH
jgi:hypothetical protein